ncbi:alpha/beta hydrolase [Chitinophaga lutea]|uniref:Alpha/beta hydrolase n=1 Tax=Chitinophaga lutea TaxID=2488634 RepID=A0A3N4PI97_9BACT|nr:alpha/beta hydrolase [Chitinophaga lutea]RPE07926.1 alpha/beta hydrolase [Chitinophaga lutea]
MKPFAPAHRQVTVDGASIHIVEAGNGEARTIILLHGYPGSWLSFERVMALLSDRFHVVAVDLPGIGASKGNSPADKKSIAACLDGLMERLGVKEVLLAGHDIGGMVVYAFLRHFPQRLSRAVILDTAVPGIAPWEEVKKNPNIWHFAFYAVPALPEALAAGKQKLLFDYFYNTLAAAPGVIPASNRIAHAEAYREPAALKTSFDWYRAFPQDEKDNAGTSSPGIPLLYVRGEKEPGDINDYVNGFRKSGLRDVTGKIIPGSGHFSPEEQPEAVAEALAAFMA